MHRVFDIPLISVVRDQFVQFTREILLFLLVGLVFLEQPAALVSDPVPSSIRRTHRFADPVLILSCRRSAAVSLIVLV